MTFEKFYQGRVAKWSAAWSEAFELLRTQAKADWAPVDDERSRIVIMSGELVEAIRQESYKDGWNAALKHVQATNGEGVKHYL
ncbi:hypothetical protein [Nonomuraea sp. NPDC052265]|uniref:hypothetical protein n=1 Tax=Nonomuraea sp. NPDC052265 TaxID=3364374 RepID=UPI0037C7BCAF